MKVIQGSKPPLQVQVENYLDVERQRWLHIQSIAHQLHIQQRMAGEAIEAIRYESCALQVFYLPPDPERYERGISQICAALKLWNNVLCSIEFSEKPGVVAQSALVCDAAGYQRDELVLSCLIHRKRLCETAITYARMQLTFMQELFDARVRQREQSPAALQLLTE